MLRLIVAHPSVSASDVCIHKTTAITPQVSPLINLSGVPSLLPSYDRCGSEPHMLNRFRSILGLADGGNEGDMPLSDKSVMNRNIVSGVASTPSQESIAPFLLEMQDWRPLYINNRELHHTGIACRVLSELGMSEITITAATGSCNYISNTCMNQRLLKLMNHFHQSTHND